jgi:hypothetical protein
LAECGPCPALASYTLAFALQPSKKHGKTSVRVKPQSLIIIIIIIIIIAIPEEAWTGLEFSRRLNFSEIIIITIIIIIIVKTA